MRKRCANDTARRRRRRSGGKSVDREGENILVKDMGIMMPYVPGAGASLLRRD